MKPKIAIVGAGLAGLTAAQRLRPHAHVQVFEKSQGVGGRMATKRLDIFEFDHGAQFFTARNKVFKTWLKPYIRYDMVRPWYAHFAELDRNKVTHQREWHEEFPHYVPTPKMTSLCQSIAQDCDVKLNCKIEQMNFDNTWTLIDSEQKAYEGFDWVLIAMPAEQAAQLIPDSCEFYQAIKQVDMAGCYSLLLGLSEPLNLSWQAALVHHANISWISMNSSKPGRKSHPAYVVHSTNHWAQAHMDDDIEQVQAMLLDEFCSVTEIDCQPHIAAIHTHRWRFANIEKHEPMTMVDSRLKLAAMGDWSSHGRIEAACLSGLETSNLVAEQLK